MIFTITAYWPRSRQWGPLSAGSCALRTCLHAGAPAPVSTAGTMEPVPGTVELAPAVAESRLRALSGQSWDQMHTQLYPLLSIPNITDTLILYLRALPPSPSGLLSRRRQAATTWARPRLQERSHVAWQKTEPWWASPGWRARPQDAQTQEDPGARLSPPCT